MIEEMINTGLAPFMDQVGWQGFAYGLLGLKTLKRMIQTIINLREGGDNGDNS